MSVTELSDSAQNHLKAVWSLSEWTSEPVTTKDIAEKTGLRISTVSDAVRKLAEQGYLNHAKYGTVELTETGRIHAVAMVRRHRLIESFLVEVLGYGWEQVHDEAEVLEHAVSDFMIERIDVILEHPTRDPHGDPIPAADGTVEVPDAVQLTGVEPGTTVVVERISDSDSELLGYFRDRNISCGARLTVGAGEPYSGTLEVQVDGSGQQPLSLGQTASDALFVSVATG
ncbi:metal-dependent transcriptional regulator [Arthrobacter rhombi]|uniref:metal-dependent transcriptional regulator n=1 Tax=Arthrobacter rhombi TaxID=71253 RepID=UPI003FD49905